MKLKALAKLVEKPERSDLAKDLEKLELKALRKAEVMNREGLEPDRHSGSDKT
jgi:hypothetical protein